MLLLVVAVSRRDGLLPCVPVERITRGTTNAHTLAVPQRSSSCRSQNRAHVVNLTKKLKHRAGKKTARTHRCNDSTADHQKQTNEHLANVEVNLVVGLFPERTGDQYGGCLFFRRVAMRRKRDVRLPYISPFLSSTAKQE